MSIFEFDQEANDRELYNYALEKGIEQGIEQGRKQGIEQGAERERENIIVELARQDFPINAIAAATKMTIPQVEAILEKVMVTA